MIGIAFGNDEGRITDANDAFLQLAGYTREDLVADGISLARADAGRVPPRGSFRPSRRCGATGRCTPFEVGSDPPRRPPRPGARRRRAPLGAAPRRRRVRARHLATGASSAAACAAELACADALLDAPTRDQAIVDALAARLRDARAGASHGSGGARAAGELALRRQRRASASADATVARSARPSRRARRRQGAMVGSRSDRSPCRCRPTRRSCVAHGGPSALCPSGRRDDARDRARALQNFPEEEPRLGRFRERVPR